ncbi:hypothetical protein EJ02DRAFT_451941 [Clathrospora elynae]|uniref:Uncharacterized protein n=1 Tax=Clathrospora elynae TaxID=706981 RepID=A0A6A5T305_9PLEO|nr:hypothetical protein EJ02DRAFT_451941 [Clathrospora elynae]
MHAVFCSLHLCAPLPVDPQVLQPLSSHSLSKSQISHSVMRLNAPSSPLASCTPLLTALSYILLMLQVVVPCIGLCRLTAQVHMRWRYSFLQRETGFNQRALPTNLRGASCASPLRRLQHRALRSFGSFVLTAAIPVIFISTASAPAGFEQACSSRQHHGCGEAVCHHVPSRLSEGLSGPYVSTSRNILVY